MSEEGPRLLVKGRADMKTLYRSTTHKWLAGVFGGLGEIEDTDPNILRLVALFLGIVTGILPLLITYFVAWLVIPQRQPV
jgi:phage shock protein C